MSEKRILIQEIKGTCIFREVHETCAGGFCEVDLMCAKQKGVKCDKARFNACTKKVLNGITHAEAVERMAHALCVKIHGPCENCEQVRGGNEGHCNDYKSYAEAALNALLKR